MGSFIAIEGGDGSGKGTQTELLVKHARENLGRNVLQLSFPSYGDDSAYFVEQYLNKSYGDNPDEIPAELASLAYAIDRHAKSPLIRDSIADPNGVAITDRFVASNMAHQGTKFNSLERRHAFYDRILTTEHGVLTVPEPDMNIVLVVPTELAQANVDKKAARGYTTLTRDLHEENASHLERAKANFIELVHLYPDRYQAIHCIDRNGGMRGIEDINKELVERVRHLL